MFHRHFPIFVGHINSASLFSLLRDFFSQVLPQFVGHTERDIYRSKGLNDWHFSREKVHFTCLADLTKIRYLTHFKALSVKIYCSFWSRAEFHEHWIRKTSFINPVLFCFFPSFSWPGILRGLGYRLSTTESTSADLTYKLCQPHTWVSIFRSIERKLIQSLSWYGIFTWCKTIHYRHLNVHSLSNFRGDKLK